MAIKTGEIFNSLVFGGVNSADYGIYITGEGVFNAPKRAVNMVAVPGRNGSIAIDQGHWENIEVTYPAGTFGMDEQEFRTALSNFRNAIASQVGYQRLTDTYHPDEYRMALYSEGLEVEPTTYNKAGEFELKFNCKPQRWLTSGEVPVTIGEWGATKTASGEIVTIESEGGEAAKSLEVSLEPIQAGSGTPSPTNIRPISGRTEVVTWDDPKYGGTVAWNQLVRDILTQTKNGITCTNNGDGSYTFNGTSTARAQFFLNGEEHHINANDKMLVCANNISGTCSSTFNIFWYFAPDDGSATQYPSMVVISSDGTVRDTANIRNMSKSGKMSVNGIALDFQYENTTLNSFKVTPQVYNLTQMFGSTIADYIYSLEQATAGAGVAYFRNLFPNDYYEYNAGETTCVSAVNGDTYNQYTTALGRTVYGGTLDVTSGVLTVTHATRTFDGTEDWRNPDSSGICWFRDDTLKKTSNYEGTIIASTMPTARTRLRLREDFECGISGYEASGADNYWYIKAPNQTTQTATALKAWLQANNVQACYELATPQTYQLTPQEVELLLGENHVWSDGSITLQYGDDPNSLWNPTRYDAGPLLAVKGHGDVSFNGYTVAIDAGQYGVINVKGKQTSTAPITYTTDVSLYNDGDTIYAFVECDWVLTTLRNIYARSYSNQHDTGVGQTVMEPRSTSGNNRAVGTTIIDSSVLSSQDETLTNTFSFDSELSNGTTVTVSVVVEVTWSATNKTLSVSSSVPHATGWGGSHRTFPTITIEAASTKTYLGDPTLVDCELGEAYKVEDGEIISLNKYIELGSDLPTLSSGANDVTTDNTITELQVTPNWWKL